MSESEKKECVKCHGLIISNVYPTMNGDMCLNCAKESFPFTFNKVLNGQFEKKPKIECVKCHVLIISDVIDTFKGDMCLNCSGEPSDEPLQATDWRCECKMFFREDQECTKCAIKYSKIKPYIYKNGIPDTVEFKMLVHDEINSPAHYKKGGIETLDFIKAKLSSEEFQGFLKANIIKYVSRASLKGGVKDYKKAQFYLNKLVEILDVKKV